MVFADENRWRHRKRRGRGRAIVASAALIAFAGAAIYGAMMIADSSGASADPSAAGQQGQVPAPNVVIPVSSLPAFADAASSPGSPTPSASARPSRSPAATSPGTPAATPAANSPDVNSPAATSAPAGSQTIAVNYIVDQQSSDGFQGEVEVVNDTSQTLSGWQIVVGLPLDQVESVQNASASVTDNILFMRPQSAADSIAPGAVLRVFFTAEGTETTPSGCAFNEINCS